MPSQPLWRPPSLRPPRAGRPLALVPVPAAACDADADADADADGAAAPAAPAAPAVPSAPDAERLLAELAQRLRTCAEKGAACTRGAGAGHAAACACTQALERLRPALAFERQLRERATHDVGGLRAALAHARAELAGTRARERQARHLAEHDELTALPRRSALHERLERALAVPHESGPTAPPLLAVMFLDLDDFKPVNDRHGHAVGDELLRIVAQRLCRALRTQDLVCRVGGDEFACLLSSPMGRPQLGQLAVKLFDAVAAPLQVAALALAVRPSIGIAVCPRDGDSARVLLERADAAMYRAKRRQLGHAFFDPRLDA